MTNETLEELGRFAERKYLEGLNNYENCDFSNGVIEGAKWQAERSYTDEEVKHIVSEALQSALVTVDLEQWFKQFKKK